MLGRVQYRYAQTIKCTHHRKSLLVGCFLHPISDVNVLGGTICGAKAQQGCAINPYECVDSASEGKCIEDVKSIKKRVEDLKFRSEKKNKVGKVMSRMCKKMESKKPEMKSTEQT